MIIQLTIYLWDAAILEIHQDQILFHYVTANLKKNSKLITNDNHNQHCTNNKHSVNQSMTTSVTTCVHQRIQKTKAM